MNIETRLRGLEQHAEREVIADNVRVYLPDNGRGNPKPPADSRVVIYQPKEREPMLQPKS